MSADGETAAKTTWYAWYSLAILFLVYTCNFIDRAILGILNEPIRQELGLTDTHMGFLGGIAFAVFYTFLGIPIARIADRSNRRNLLAICLTLWSAMTALCGLAQNFIQLLLARIGVAVGESGCSPAAHSMISDTFPPSARATALSIYALGIPVGTMIGNAAGGWINENFDWRTAFVVVGLPGVALALWMCLTLREPARGAMESTASPVDDPPPIMDVFRYLWSLRSFRFLCIAGSLHAFVGNGIGFWLPAFYIRTHGLGTADLGFYLLYAGAAGMLGTFLGGYMGDKLSRSDLRWYVWLPGAATLISVPFSLYAYIADDYIHSFISLSVTTMLGAYFFGPTFAITHSLVGLRMRALASSLVLFLLNLIGLGLGPQITGIVSDLYGNIGIGGDSLRWALVSVVAFNVIAAVLYWRCGRYLLADMQKRAMLDDQQKGS